MAKAICTRKLVHNFPFIVIEEGEVVDYTVKDKRFIVRDITIVPPAFFNHFKVTEGIDKMSYSDFEYILCNYVYTMAMLYPTDIGDGESVLIIKDWDNKRIHILINEKENSIFVSFNYGSYELYESYEDALEGIRNHSNRKE